MATVDLPKANLNSSVIKIPTGSYSSIEWEEGLTHISEERVAPDLSTLSKQILRTAVFFPPVLIHDTTLPLLSVKL